MKTIYSSTLTFIILIVVIDTAGFGLIFSVLPKLLDHVLRSDISTAARYGGWLSFTYAAMQFVFSPVLGNLSDQYGRRPLLLYSLLGFSVDCIFLAFAPTVFWLFVGRAIAGLTGGSYAVASACIADISSRKDRTRNFGLLNSGFGLGFIIGPVIGGVLGQLGGRTPLLFAAILSLSNFIFGYFIFPESMKFEDRRRFHWRSANAFSAFGNLRKFPLVKGLIVCILFVSVANHCMESVWAFFTIERFSWNDAQIGYSLAFIGVLSIVVQLWLVDILAKRSSDRRIATTGFILLMTGFILLAFTPWQWLLFIAIVIVIAGGIQATAVQSIVSSAIPDNKQGELQGVLGCLTGLTTLAAPIIMTGSFSYFTRDRTKLYFPGMPFLIASILILLALILFLMSFRSRGKTEQEIRPCRDTIRGRTPCNSTDPA